jgi:hypothetical protein
MCTAARCALSAVLALVGCPGALGSGMIYEDTWVMRYVAAMPDGYPRQVIAATPIAELVPVHIDPDHPWNDTLAVEPDIVAFPGPVVRVQQGGRVSITSKSLLPPLLTAGTKKKPKAKVSNALALRQRHAYSGRGGRVQ